MALPKLQDTTLRYEMTIPSTGKKVRYRPFLVKEEKSLMIAMESKDTKTIINTLLGTLKTCIDGEIIVEQLPTFDVEHMFLNIRSKSVGETTKIGMKCSECNQTTEIVVPIDQIQINVPKLEKTIRLTDDISVDIDWPTYASLADIDVDNQDTESLFQVMAKCFKSINTAEERINASEVPLSEIEEFIESMTQAQFNKIKEFMDAMPRLKHDIEFKCSHCNHDNKITVEGLESFLS